MTGPGCGAALEYRSSTGHNHTVRVITDFPRLANDAINRLEFRYGRGWLLSRPVEVILEPTNRCNSRCLMCMPYRRAGEGGPSSGFLSWDMLRSCAPLLRRARRVLFSGFGEPLLHPEFAEMASWIKQRVPFLYFFTNGALITEELADKLVAARVDAVVFSIGGATAGTYEHVRGMDMEQPLGGIANLVFAKARRGCHLPELSFNVVQMNSVLPELPGIVDAAVRFGVNRISLPQMWVENEAARQESVFTNPTARALIEQAVAYAGERGVAMTASSLVPVPRRCSSPWDTMYVSYDGDVYSCAVERYRMGNVAVQRPLALWRSGGYRALRHQLSRDPKAICPNCPVATGAVESFLNPARHGRAVCEDFLTTAGPTAVCRERVLSPDI